MQLNTDKLSLTADLAKGAITSLRINGKERLAAESALFRVQLCNAQGERILYSSLDASTCEENENGAVFIRPHSGQVYSIGGAKLEVLSSPDDVFYTPLRDCNAASLVIKMTIAGQTVLMSADASYAAEKLASRYGDFLKCDILQLPHHGFGGGDPATYRIIDPHTVLIPVQEWLMYGTMNIHYKHNPPLLFDMNVRDFYSGATGDITLTLPHTPRPNGVKLMFDTVEKYRKQAGACTWFFCDMTLDEAKFTIVNTSQVKVPVWVNLYFEDSSDLVRAIKVEAKGYAVTRVDLSNPEDIDDDAKFFNRNSLKKKGIKEGAVFTVRLNADAPIVVKGPRAADFYA